MLGHSRFNKLLDLHRRDLGVGCFHDECFGILAISSATQLAGDRREPSCVEGKNKPFLANHCSVRDGSMCEERLFNLRRSNLQSFDLYELL